MSTHITRAENEFNRDGQVLTVTVRRLGEHVIFIDPTPLAADYPSDLLEALAKWAGREVAS